MKYNRIIQESMEVVADESMVNATIQAIEENEGNSDISVAYDGSWQKRGFKSKNGIATLTSFDTGKVLDLEVLTKYCSGCTIPKSESERASHEPNCVKNYEGASGGMESVAAVSIFHRSQERS